MSSTGQVWQDTDVIILAGGYGKRLQPLTLTMPKPLLKVAGKPILEYSIENLREVGVKNLLIVVGYLKQMIIDYFGKGDHFGMNIEYISTDTIGYSEEAIKTGLAKCTKRMVLCLCGDDIVMVSHLNNLISVDAEKYAGAAIIKTVKTSPLPRLSISQDLHISGLSYQKNDPILTYNFWMRKSLLQILIDNYTEQAKPLIYYIDKIIIDLPILAILTDDLLTINTLEQLRSAEKQLKE